MTNENNIAWETYALANSAEPGTTAPATVISVVKTTWRATIQKEAALKKFLTPDENIVLVTAMLEDGTEATLKAALPAKNLISPKSKLGKYMKLYGGAPTMGQKVKAIANESGYYDIYVR